MAVKLVAAILASCDDVILVLRKELPLLERGQDQAR